MGILFIYLLFQLSGFENFENLQPISIAGMGGLMNLQIGLKDLRARVKCFVLKTGQSRPGKAHRRDVVFL